MNELNRVIKALPAIGAKVTQLLRGWGRRAIRSFVAGPGGKG